MIIITVSVRNFGPAFNGWDGHKQYDMLRYERRELSRKEVNLFEEYGLQTFLNVFSYYKYATPVSPFLV